MSLSPQPVNHAIPSPATLANTPPSSLAALLADSYHELESLRRELAIVRKRAEKAERLSSSLQALSADSNPNQDSNPPFPDSATRILMDFEDRAVRAELARDEAEARKRILMDTWSQLDSYLAAISGAAADARAGYSRVVSEGGGHLVLAQIPTLPTRRVPSSYSHPHPVSTGTRRARTPSIDGYQQQPTTKRPRAEDRASVGIFPNIFYIPLSYSYTAAPTISRRIPCRSICPTTHFPSSTTPSTPSTHDAPWSSSYDYASSTTTS